MSNTIIETKSIRFSYTDAEGVAPIVLDGVSLEIESIRKELYRLL